MSPGRSERFDLDLVQSCMMGPNCLRFIDDLTSLADLPREIRVLDLGCGRGLTSLFLACEYDAQVFALDLWIDPAENYLRFQSLGFGSRIIPLHGDAKALPFATGYFDAVVSIDAYHYFGAEEGFLQNYITPLVKKDGLILAAMPGLQKDFLHGVPPELLPFWQENMHFHTPLWWSTLWERSGAVKMLYANDLWSHTPAWQDWLECDSPYAQEDIAMIEAEKGRYFNTVGLIARVL